MRTLSKYITEAIKIGRSVSNISVYSCQPKTRDELKEIIDERIKQEGSNCDLNDIDTSLIENMSWVFALSEFNGDISKWNTSNVKNMSYLFYKSSFNGNISDWGVHNVENMIRMFAGSRFNQDISKWKINKDCDTTKMFIYCSIKEEFKPKSLQKK